MTTSAPTRDLVRRQLDLEEEAHTLGAIRYQKERPLPWRTGEDAAAEDEEANLPPGKQLIRLTVEPTAALLKEKITAAREGSAGRMFSAVKWLENASPEEVAYLAARVAINAAVKRSKLQATAIQLANAIIHHVEMVLFAEKNKAGYVGLIRSNYRRTRGSTKREQALRKLLASEDVRLTITATERVHLGIFVLETLIEATGFFTLDLENNGNRDKLYTIRPTEAVEDWLENQHARSALLEPMAMPMIVRPKRWRSPYVGGYLKRPPVGGHLIRVNKSFRQGDVPAAKDYLQRLSQTDLTPVYEAVNHVQETAWAINEEVLKVVREVWDSGGSIAGLPMRHDTPLPARPYDIDTNPDALTAWKREAAITHDENARHRSARLGVQQRLWMAERFVKEDAFWFPHSMDFRGRIYPIPNMGFSPQSDDLGKALLRFAEGKPLGETGPYWLAVHIANLFGVDKVSFADRVKWTYDHSREIIDSAVLPLDGERFWTTADDPWMALAASMEFAGHLEQGAEFVSHLPIPLDGSNSGLQHFSAMLRDPVGAAAVNLIPASEPQDIYETVAARAQAFVDADDDPEAAPWKGGKVSRKIAKRPTMTFVYSATRFGMQDMVLQTLREIDQANAAQGKDPHLGGADNYASARYLSHVLYRAIGEVVSAAQGAMDWLREVAKIAADAQQALEWTTPDGLLVRQAYRNVFAKRVKVHWQGKLMWVTLAVTGSALDARGQANGVAPNLVHSLDAAHLRAVVRAAAASGIDSLAVIHDSFGTHAADTDKLVGLLRETFVEQYRPDVLRAFYEEITAQLPEEWAREVPLPPALGELDLEAVLASPYLFA